MGRPDISNSLWQFLDAQHELQVEAMGSDPMLLQGEERLEFIRWNVLALEDELHEMLGETGWKPWAKSQHVHEVPALKEMIDAWHFFMNIMMALAPNVSTGATATPRDVEADLEALAVWFGQAYFQKRQVNIKRQEENYDGLSSKCPNCKRELSEVPMHQHYQRDGVIYCRMACASQVDQAVHSEAKQRMKNVEEKPDRINPNTMMHAPSGPDIPSIAAELKEQVHGYTPNVREDELPIKPDAVFLHGKAGKILEAVRGTDEPVFIFRAKDMLSVQVINFYAKLVEEYQGDDAEMGESVQHALMDFRNWQKANTDKVRLPD